jgi:hypothetical protein
LLLKKGDVFLCSQKVAIQRAPNNTSNPSIIALFPIKHVDHEVMKEPALDGCWVEFVRAGSFGVQGGGTPLSPSLSGRIGALPPPPPPQVDNLLTSSFNSGFDSAPPTNNTTSKGQHPSDIFQL